MEDARVVSNFILQALKGQPLTVYGDDRLLRPSARAAVRRDGPPRPVEAERERRAFPGVFFPHAIEGERPPPPRLSPAFRPAALACTLHLFSP